MIRALFDARLPLRSAEGQLARAGPVPYQWEPLAVACER